MISEAIFKWCDSPFFPQEVSSTRIQEVLSPQAPGSPPLSASVERSLISTWIQETPKWLMTCSEAEPEMRWKMRCPEKKKRSSIQHSGWNFACNSNFASFAEKMKKQQFKASIPWGGGHHLSAQQWHSWDIGLSSPWIELDK